MNNIVFARTGFLLAILILVGLTSCLDTGTGLDPLSSTPAGAYTYISFDSSGTEIVRGWFTLIVSDTGRVSGEWHFAAVANRTGIGHQVGDGQLDGMLTGTTLNVDLNPQMRDNNVFLSGKLDATGYRGTWVWATLVGPTNYGTFVAVKK